MIRGPRRQLPSGLKHSANHSAVVQKAPPSERQGGRWRNRGVDPETKTAEAHAKVERLQKALDALGNLGGPEVDAIKRSLKKAQEAARERPVGVLVKECKEFIDRSTKRITKLKAELDAETVAPGEPCTSVAVGGPGGCDPTHSGAHGTWCTGCQFAADGESVAGRTRRSLPRVETESRTQGQDILGWRCASRFEQYPCCAGRSPGNRRVDGSKKSRRT